MPQVLNTLKGQAGSSKKVRCNYCGKEYALKNSSRWITHIFICERKNDDEKRNSKKPVK